MNGKRKETYTTKQEVRRRDKDNDRQVNRRSNEWRKQRKNREANPIGTDRGDHIRIWLLASGFPFRFIDISKSKCLLVSMRCVTCSFSFLVSFLSASSSTYIDCIPWQSVAWVIQSDELRTKGTKVRQILHRGVELQKNYKTECERGRNRGWMQQEHP